MKFGGKQGDYGLLQNVLKSSLPWLQRTIIGVLILGLVLLGSVRAVGATPDSQTWYFTNTDASAPVYTDANYNKIMMKGVEGGEGTVVTLGRGERVWFYTDELAQCDVTFPAGVWDTVCWVKALDSGDSGKSCSLTAVKSCPCCKTSAARAVISGTAAGKRAAGERPRA